MSLVVRQDEWPVKLFKMRGFTRVDFGYQRSTDRMVVTVYRNNDAERAIIELPTNYRSMTLEAFRNWVDIEVSKLFGASDFPTISLKPVPCRPSCASWRTPAMTAIQTPCDCKETSIDG